MSFIFISYSKKNKDYANKLAGQLQAEGFDIWIDKRIEAGEDWWEAIHKALSDCAAVIVIMSPDSESSEWVKREITIADQMKKTTFPLLLAGSPELVKSPRWSIYVRTQYEDVRNGLMPSGNFYNRLEQSVPRQEKGRQIAPSYGNQTTMSAHPINTAMPSAGEFELPLVKVPSLIVRRGPQPNQIYELSKKVTNLGRDNTNDIVLNDNETSRFHLRFTHNPDTCTVEDLGSTNGSFLNGIRVIGAVSLKHGDLISLGETVLLQYVQAHQGLFHLQKVVFRITVLLEPQLNQVYELNKDIISLGRETTNDIVINDRDVSRHHLRFSYRGDGFCLEDLGTVNGTFINGFRLNPKQTTKLKHGDKIRLGETVTLAYEIRAR